MSGELSQFESKSALVPTKTPYGILGGFIIAVIVFVLVSMFGTNEAVDDLKKADADKGTTQAAPRSSGGSVDEL